MITIYKYELQANDEQIISANIVEFLSVQVQNGVICLWALVDNAPHLHTPNHLIKMLTTGTPITVREVASHQFLDTFQLHDGHFVGHVFVPKL